MENIRRFILKILYNTKDIKKEKRKKIRILYGVCGEGLGHTIESKVILTNLIKRYEIMIIAPGRAFDVLSKDFPNVLKVPGLNIAYENNKVNIKKTISLSLSNFKKDLPLLKKTVSKINKFNPDIVISDFEIISSFYSNINGLPLICINNIPVLAKTKIKVPFKEYSSYLAAKTIVNIVVPMANLYLLNTFFQPRSNKKNECEYIPFILRKSIIEAKRKEGSYLFVYQTSTSNLKLIDILKNAGIPCTIYGFNKEETDKNLIFRKFNEKMFIKELASCKAVISNGGYVLMSEAIYLKKPMLSMPVKGQFEQSLNAGYLQKYGFGMKCENATEKDLIMFLKKYDYYKKNLERYRYEGMSKIFSILNKKINEFVNNKNQ